VRKRHERFREALEIINLLWQGGYQSYDGIYFELDDARHGCAGRGTCSALP